MPGLASWLASWLEEFEVIGSGSCMTSCGWLGHAPPRPPGEGRPLRYGRKCTRVAGAGEGRPGGGFFLSGRVLYDEGIRASRMPTSPGAALARRQRGNRSREIVVQPITKLRIATRKSQLAMWQAEHVRDRLLALHPGLEVELVAMATRGDKILDTPLAKVGGKGLFVKAVSYTHLTLPTKRIV